VECGVSGGLRRAGRLGVRLKSNESPEQIQALEQLPLIAIEFPSFTDGRGYTSARLLRERHAYRGSCGRWATCCATSCFTWRAAGSTRSRSRRAKTSRARSRRSCDFSVTYQAAADDERPLFRRVSR
jgi:uncharacterized protein (DUF934 family)